MTEREDGAVESSGQTESEHAIESMRLWTTRVGIPMPPIPGECRPTIRQQGQATWATEVIQPRNFYFFGQTVQHLSTMPVGSYAFSFGGHGLNSWAITLRLVVPGLSLAVQTLFGGVLADAEVLRDGVSAMLDAVGRCLQVTRETEPGRQAGVVQSDFRSISCVKWLDAMSPADFEPRAISKSPWPALLKSLQVLLASE